MAYKFNPLTGLLDLTSRPATGESLGTGEDVYADTDAGVLQFKSLLAGLGIVLTSDATTITIATGGAYYPGGW